MQESDDLGPKKPTRAKKIRTAVAVAVALGCVGVAAYLRYGIAKASLGGPCAFKASCASEAPVCLKQTEDADGVCSRPCDAGVACAEGIACVEVELDERDERGVPKKGGFCVPQAILDARKKKPDAAVAKTTDSWLDVPEIPGQLEGELDLKWDPAHAVRDGSFTVKGSLVRLTTPARVERIADASSMRVFLVDHDQKTFAASAAGGMPAKDPRLTKTGTKDRVADRECEIWKLEEEKVTRELCVVSGGAFLDPARDPEAWLRELATRNAFALRMIARDASGAETARMTATRVDLHPVDAQRFVVPKSYKNRAQRGR